MKKRWMQSIIEASTHEVPAMPFSRRVRHLRKTRMSMTQIQNIKIA